MKKMMKILAYTVLAVIVLLAIAVATLMLFVDPNQFKPMVAEQVEKATQRKLDIEGDLSWQLWPPIGIKIGKTQLHNRAPFGDGPMLKIDQVVVEVAIIPLLSNKVEVQQVLIDGLYVHLVTNKQGVTNIDDLTQGKKETPPSAEPDGKTGADTPMPEVTLSQGIKLTNITFINENQQTSETQSLTDLNLTIGQFEFDKWFGLAFDVAVASEQAQISADIEWQSEIFITKDMKHIQIRSGELSLKAKGKALPQPVDLQVSTGINLDLLKDNASIAPLALVVNGLKLDAPTTIEHLTTGATTNTSLTLHQFSARKLLTDLGIVLDTRNEKALSKVGLTSTIDFNSQSKLLTINDLKIQLDDSQMTGKAEVKPGDILFSRFTLALNQLNVDDYLPPPPPKTEGDEASVPAKQEQPQPAPDVSVLKTLDVDGNISVKQLVANNVAMHDMKLHLVIKNGVAKIAPFTAALYEGSLNTQLSLDANPKVPEFSLNQTISGVQIHPLLKAIADVDLLSGGTELKMKFTGKGLTPESIKSTLSGNGQFVFADGAVNGINIAELLRQGNAQLTGKPVAKSTEPKKTDFTELQGSFSIKNGKFVNPDLHAKSPLLRIEGSGDIDLLGDKIDYLARIALVDSFQGQGGKSMKELEGLIIPLTVKGSLAKPDIGLKLDELVSDKVKAEAKQQAKILEDKAKEKAKEEAKKVEDKAKKKLEDALKDKIKLW